MFYNKLKTAIENINKEFFDNKKVGIRKMDGFKIKTFFMIQKQKT